MLYVNSADLGSIKIEIQIQHNKFGSDLIRNVKLWNGNSYDNYNANHPSSLAAFNRFCSADLPPLLAFYNPKSGKGTRNRIYMNGEEVSEGRAMAHIVTGPHAGNSYQLPWMGRMAWENLLANGYPSNKTIVACMDDATITTGNVYFYIGTKMDTGAEIERAGLAYGKLYGVKISGFSQERTSITSINNPPAPGTHFDLVDLGVVENLTGTQLDAASSAAGATYFSRPEDGAWDPSKPTDFYFNTTDQLDEMRDGVGIQVGRSRLWRLRFTDIQHPELGGTVKAVLNGSEGQNMMDNMAIDKEGHIILLEDVAGSAHNGKIWKYDIKTDELQMIGKHDPARFGNVDRAATPPFNQDEETSGVVDVQDILGKGWYLLDDQTHYNTGIPADIVEGGQLLAIHYNPSSHSAETNASAALVSSPPGITGKLSVSVAPNPASTYTKVSVSGAKGTISVTLNDFNGRAMWRSSTQNSIISIPTAGLSRGIYIVKVQSGVEKANAKLIIEK